IEMEDPGPRTDEVVDLLAEPEEVARIQRGLDLDLPYPPLPGHAEILRVAHARDEEPRRAVNVRESEQRLRPARMAEFRELGAEVVGRQAERVHDLLVLRPVNRADRVRDRAARAHPFGRYAQHVELQTGKRLRPPAA